MGKWRRSRSLPKRWARSQLIRQYGNVCHLCGKQIESMKDVTIDHWVPLSKGGKDEYENYRLAHPTCNNAKADMEPEKYERLQSA